jgi:hypothetical protein
VSAALTVASGFFALVADVVAGYYSVLAADLYDEAAGALTDPGPHSSEVLIKSAHDVYSKALVAIAVRSVNSAVTLSVMALAFAIILYCSVTIFRSVENFGVKTLLSVQVQTAPGKKQLNVQNFVTSVSHALKSTVDAAIEQRRHLTFANALILITFPPCLCYYLLFAYANFNQVRIVQASHGARCVALLHN